MVVVYAVVGGRLHLLDAPSAECSKLLPLHDGGELLRAVLQSGLWQPRLEHAPVRGDGRRVAAVGVVQDRLHELGIPRLAHGLCPHVVVEPERDRVVLAGPAVVAGNGGVPRRHAAERDDRDRRHRHSGVGVDRAPAPVRRHCVRAGHRLGRVRVGVVEVAVVHRAGELAGDDRVLGPRNVGPHVGPRAVDDHIGHLLREPEHAVPPCRKHGMLAERHVRILVRAVDVVRAVPLHQGRVQRAHGSRQGRPRLHARRLVEPGEHGPAVGVYLGHVGRAAAVRAVVQHGHRVAVVVRVLPHVGKDGVRVVVVPGLVRDDELVRAVRVRVDLAALVEDADRVRQAVHPDRRVVLGGVRVHPAAVADVLPVRAKLEALCGRVDRVALERAGAARVALEPAHLLERAERAVVVERDRPLALVPVLEYGLVLDRYGIPHVVGHVAVCRRIPERVGQGVLAQVDLDDWRLYAGDDGGRRRAHNYLALAVLAASPAVQLEPVHGL